MAARRRAGLSPPARDTARGAVAAHRGGARGPAKRRGAAAVAPLGCGDRRGASPGDRDRPLDGARSPATLTRRRIARRAERSRDITVSAPGGAVPDPHRGAAHQLPVRSTRRPTRRALRGAGARSPRHDTPDARFAGGAGCPAQEPARRPGSGVGADRPVLSHPHPRRRAADQPGIETAQRAAAAADGGPRRLGPRTHAGSIVMHSLQLVFAAAIAAQQPAAPATIAPTLARAQAALAAAQPAVAALTATAPRVATLAPLHGLPGRD